MQKYIGQFLIGCIAGLVVSTATGQAPPAAPFTRMTNGVIATELFRSASAAWGDYDDDGFLDLFVGNVDLTPRNSLFRNNRDGTFAKITTGALATAPTQTPHAASWADYNNDGKLDIAIANLFGTNNPIYRNLGNGAFSLINVAPGDEGAVYANSVAVSWADYDADGLLDLFVANGAFVSRKQDLLYHNDGANRFSG